jgi:hypothetical protein
MRNIIGGLSFRWMLSFSGQSICLIIDVYKRLGSLQSKNRMLDKATRRLDFPTAYLSAIDKRLLVLYNYQSCQLSGITSLHGYLPLDPPPPPLDDPPPPKNPPNGGSTGRPGITIPGILYCIGSIYCRGI